MIEIVPQTGSTSDDLAARLSRGDPAPEGHWLIADRQTAGRGRLGRDWKDGGGNFMGSTVVYLRPGDPAAPTLALLAGVSLHDLLAPRVKRGLQLKWPNDLLAGGAKLAGILLERVGDAVVVGVGVNLVTAPDVPGRTTVALADIGGAVERDAFSDALTRQFATDLERWRSFGVGPVINRWLAAGHAHGTSLSVAGAQGARLEGNFVGLTEDGALQLRLADGAVRVIHAGQVDLV